MLYGKKNKTSTNTVLRSTKAKISSRQEFELNCLYLKLSAIFGIFPIGRIRRNCWKHWPLAMTIILTSINVASIALNSYRDYKKWMANVKDLLNDFALILAATNLNVCVILHNVIAARSSSTLGRLLKNLDQGKRNSSLMAAFEIACMTTSVANFIVVRYPKMLQIAGAVIRIVLTYLAMLILVQYSAFLEHFGCRIRLLTEKLRNQGSSACEICRRKYFEIASNIEETNRIYSRQMIFVMAEVFYKLVIFGYFLLTNYDFNVNKTANAVAAILSEAGMLIHITITCYVVQNNAKRFHRQLFRTMRNSNLYGDKKLTLVLKMNKTVSFTAGGFVQIGNGLLMSMIAAVSTYLVTLVQFSK